MLSSGIVLLYDNSRSHTAAATKRLLKRFEWEVFDHPPSSARTWLPVMFIYFLVWNGRKKATFWQNELQTSVENWLKAQAAGFYDEGIGKLILRYKKCLCRSVVYVETWLVDVAKWCKQNISDFHCGFNFARDRTLKKNSLRIISYKLSSSSWFNYEKNSHICYYILIFPIYKIAFICHLFIERYF